jgi:hypothetical protein
MKKKSKKNGFDSISLDQANFILSQFFIDKNLLHAKSILMEWIELGLSPRGSLTLVFEELL